MSEYRVYIFGKDGHRFLKIAEFPAVHRDDASAMQAARKLVDGHDIELWNANRLICRFTTDAEQPQTLKEFSVASIAGVPSILLVDTVKEPAQIS